MKISNKYKGTFVVQVKYRSLFTNKWSPWNDSATRGTSAAAHKVMLEMNAEPTTIPQKFRLLDNKGNLSEEINNAKNLLRK